MTRRQKQPLRLLGAEEQQELERIARATSESATRVARAKALLAVAQGHSYTAAALKRVDDALAMQLLRWLLDLAQRDCLP